MSDRFLCRNGFRRLDGVYKSSDPDHACVFAENVGHRRRNASLVLRDDCAGNSVDPGRFLRGKTCDAARGADFLATAAGFDPWSFPGDRGPGNFARAEGSDSATGMDSLVARNMDTLLVFGEFFGVGNDQENPLAGHWLRTGFCPTDEYHRAIATSSHGELWALPWNFHRKYGKFSSAVKFLPTFLQRI